MSWKLTAAANLQRFWVPAGEWVFIEAGYVAVLDAVSVLRIDGFLRLDGVVKVGRD